MGSIEKQKKQAKEGEVTTQEDSSCYIHLIKMKTSFVQSTVVVFLCSLLSTRVNSKKVCEDKSGPERCERYLKFYRSLGMGLCAGPMKHSCEVTCKICEPIPECENSRYGCCWDRKTIAKGPDGRGCSHCYDKSSSCKKIIRRNLALGLVSRKQVCAYRWTTQNCPQTCGMCGSPAMAYHQCSRSLYGCCWNNRPALGLNGKGCDECRDTYPHACYQFEYYCHKDSINTQFMKHDCPLTCGRCNAGQLLLYTEGKKYKN